jgi:hypothetical protein
LEVLKMDSSQDNRLNTTRGRDGGASTQAQTANTDVKEIDYAAAISPPPFAARDREHLIESLEEGLRSGPGIPLTKERREQRFRDLEEWAAQQE